MTDDVNHRVRVVPVHEHRLCACCIEPASLHVTFNLQVTGDKRVSYATSIALCRACSRLTVDALKEADHA